MGRPRVGAVVADERGTPVGDPLRRPRGRARVERVDLWHASRRRRQCVLDVHYLL
jgi:hypothetical protein